jgi:hypothetical protein
MRAGWRLRIWSFPICCGRCRAPIHAGVTRVNDTANPPAAALCYDCYRYILGLEPGEVDVNPANN